MSSPATPATPERSFERRVAKGWLGGVCAGLAEHTGVPVLWWRAAFAVAASWRLAGVLAYLLLWLFLPRERDVGEPLGLASASRRGLRTQSDDAASHAAVEAGSALALGLVWIGLTWFIQTMGWGVSWSTFWAWLLISTSIIGIWWHADRVTPPRGGLSWRRLRPLIDNWTTVTSLVVGAVGMAFGIGMVVAQIPNVGSVVRLLWAIALSLVALVILAAPWVLRLRASLAAAREAQLLADARADMAAHLHDSVLQTLALIQRQVHDPFEVARLARRQERELREWLYGERVAAETFVAALNATAQDVEDTHPVRVECVTVGDAPLSPALSELVKAAREAMVNAAKHSGVDKVDVYAEFDDDGTVEVFVRDRGRGFDPDAVAEDRMGVRGSIVERMRRHGGTAHVRSSAEEGTEITLEMKP